MLTIGVVGAGGVGGYIAAKLCSLQSGTGKNKTEVVVIARGDHAKAITQDGISVVEDDRTWSARPALVTTAKEYEGTFDLVLLCVKSYDIESTIESLQHSIRPDTVIIPFSNGVNHTQHIQTLVDAKVLHGAVYILSHIESPGVIRKKGNTFAIVFGSQEYVGESLHIHHIFKDADLRNKTPEDIQEAIWKKFLFISAFATLTTFLDMTIKEVMDSQPLLAKTVLEEIVAVAKAKNINLTAEVQKAIDTANSLPLSATTSMHLDVQKNHKCEYETLTGYVVREAQTLKVDAPKITEIYNILKKRFVD